MGAAQRSQTAASADQEETGIRVVELKVPDPDQVGFRFLPVEQTGLFFTNTLDSWASAANRVLNNGAGVAVGDFDRDGWEDLFFAGLSSPNRLFKNLGGWQFQDVTAQAGLRFAPGFYRGAVFADLNGDGWLDLLVGTVGAGVLCFQNDARGHFMEVTPRAGSGSAFATETLALADTDGNGTLDLYVANNRTDDIRDWLRIPVMLVNKKPVVPLPLQNRIRIEDGQLLEFGEPDLFYLNNGQAQFSAVPWTNGTFLSEAGERLSEPPFYWGLTAAFRDLNDDGAPDLYVCNDYWTPDGIWLNLGDGRFRAVGSLAVRKTTFSSMCVAFADINRDGHLDIFVADMLSRIPELRKRQMIAKRSTPPRPGEIETRLQTPRNTLLLNRGDGTYAEIAFLAGLEASDWSWCPVFLDVDLDGYEDLLITSGHFRDVQDLDANEKVESLQSAWRRGAKGTNLYPAFVAAKREHTRLYPVLEMPVIAFRNLGNLRFREMTKSWGLYHLGVNHGLALADLDNDGDMDLVVNRLGDAAAVFRNETTRPRLTVRLRGKPPNTQAIGARIELLGGPVPQQTHEVTAGGHYVSGSDTRRVFACGPGPMRLRIRWRDGSVTELPEVQSNRLYEVDQALVRATTNTSSSGSSPKLPLFQDWSHQLGHIHHEDPFDDFIRQPLLPRKLSQAGPGVAWFDLDQDGWEDLLVGSGKGGSLAVFHNQKGEGFAQNTAPEFAAVVARDQMGVLGWRTASNRPAILAAMASQEDGDPQLSCIQVYEQSPRPETRRFPGHTASVGPMALADYDADGDLDLFVGGTQVPGRYPEPAGSLVFRQQEGQWTLDEPNCRVLHQVGLVNGAVWSDLDADGLSELVLACEWGPIRVFRARAGRLQEVTADWGLAEHTGWWTGVTTGDFDEDGQMDIVAGNWGLNSPYRASPREPLTIFFGDLTGLGRVDLLECEFDPVRRQAAPRYLRDDLVDQLPFLMEQFPTHAAWSVASAADVLRDVPGPVKQWTATTLAATVFFNRNGQFEAKELPLEAQMAPAFSVQVADFDGDGHEDVFLSQNFFACRREEERLDGGRGLLLRGDGNGRLEAVPGQESGIQIYGEQRGAALADFDRDGRIDIAVSQNAAATKLYHNLRARPGLRIRLAGPSRNPDGIGAVVRLKYGDRWGPARELHAGSGYLSQDSATVVLGTNGVPTAVWVRWPGGTITEGPLASDALVRDVVISQ